MSGKITLEGTETLNQGNSEKNHLLRKPVGSVIAIERIKRFNAIFSYSKNILRAFLLLKQLTYLYLDRAGIIDMAIVCLQYMLSECPDSIELQLKLIHAYMNVGSYHLAHGN